MTDGKRPRLAGSSRASVWFGWAALLVPTLVVAGMHVEGNATALATAHTERTGLAEIVRIDAVIDAADRYREALGGHGAASGAERALAASFAALERFDAVQPPDVALGDSLRDLARDLPAVEHRRVSREARLSEWIERLVTSAATESERTQLSFDPDAEAMNLSDALGIEYQRSAERFARLLRIARRDVAAPASIAGGLLATRVATEAADAERLGYLDMELAETNTPQLDYFEADVTTLDVEALSFADFMRNEVARDGRRPSPAALALGADVVARHHALEAQIAVAFDQLLVRRIARYRSDTALTAFLAALLIVVSFAIVAWVLRALAATRELERIGAERARERAIGAVQRELVTAEEKFRATFEQVPVGILIVNGDLDTVETNTTLETLISDFDAVVDPDRDLFAAALAGAEIEPFERRYNRLDGSPSWAEVELRGVTSGTDGKPYVVGTFRDISESKALAERLLYDATHDALTGLPNRAAFAQALADALAQPHDAEHGFALLYLDLDGFKLVNDSVGHHAGDALLVQTAQRLRATLREEDVICRMGGDEFAVLLPQSDAADSERIALRIVEALREPMAFAGQSLVVGASVGVILPHAEVTKAEDVLRDADTAMYHAKSLGGGRHVVFDASMHARVRRRMQLTTDLRETIEAGAVEVVYQPIYDLRTMRLLGYEALARWQHPLFGPIGPAEFIPIAEESGSILALGRAVLVTACAQLARWRRTEPEAQSWRMNVNVAAQQISSGSIVADLRDALTESQIPPDRIFLEITESVLLEDVDRASETLSALRRIGTSVCIDDFGTGYSSLQYLQRLPIDGIKVDRSFVSDGSDGIASEPIVQMLVTLSRVLGLTIVVEGIETQDQLRRLIALGCTMGQGYFLSPPVAAAGALALARRFTEMSAS